MDDELPPPPTDVAEKAKSYGELKVKKSGPFATVRRAFTIFEKDLRTMAKHGLVSAVILFIFLTAVFSIMSFSMKQAMQFSFEGGEDKGIPGASGVDPPLAAALITPGTAVSAPAAMTFDARGSTDNGKIMFYEWDIGTEDRDIQLFGPLVHYTFYAIGSYDVHLTVVDDEWNINETSSHIEVARAPAATDTENPTIPGSSSDLMLNLSETLDLDGSMATDNVGVVNWTWYVQNEFVNDVLYGQTQSYRFDYATHYNLNLVVRDAAGNTGKTYVGANVVANPGDTEWPQARADIPISGHIGDHIELSARDSNDNQGISSYTWFIKHNNTKWTLQGETVDLELSEFGPYEIKMVVRDNAGNPGWTEGMLIATPEGMDFSMLSWTSTPFGQEISFNTFSGDIYIRKKK